MNVCPDCNKQFSDDTRFCPECGRDLQSAGGNRSRQGGGRTGGGSPQGSGSGGARAASGNSRSAQGRNPGGPSGVSAGSQDNQDAVDDLVGRTFFGDYRVTQRLGEGGMGAVYLAEHDRIDQRIALKVLHAETAESDEIVQRFHREAKVISRLSHDHIVRVFIFGRTDEDLLYMAMEYVQGVELREQLDGTPMDELRAIKIMKQICSAVAAAHDREPPIIHRDLKPENILLTEKRGDDDFVKILDFGIAKIKHPEDEQGPQLTQAGIVYGTPEYLSPEQAQAEDLDHRTDIYALGCMLFEMTTGRVPFDAEASVEILKQKVFEEPPSPSEFAPVAPTMEQTIMRAMAQDREDRFDDALDMYDALVARENELQRERQVSDEETYVPGGELTGVHRAVDPSDNPIDAVQEQAAAAQQVVVGDLDDPEEALDKTESMSRPSPEQLGAGGQQGGEARSGAAGNRPPQQPRQGNPRAQHGTPHGQQSHQAGAGGGQQRVANRDQSNPTAGPAQQAGGQQLNAAQTQQPRQAQNQQTGAFRYLLIGAVVILGVAVLTLAGYLTFMLVR